MVTSRKKLDFWFWVKVVVIGFMLIFLIYPFCTLITRSFFSNKTAGFTFENYPVLHEEVLLLSIGTKPVRIHRDHLYHTFGGSSDRVPYVPLQCVWQKLHSHFYHHESYEPAVHRCV